GMICHSVYQGSFDTNRFVDFVADKLLNVLKPFPAKHSVVVMDNCELWHSSGSWGAGADHRSWMSNRVPTTVFARSQPHRNCISDAQGLDQPQP
ncbi:hypothetical protein SAICODRAFT_57376, partial [Saitoella complicata NRRL Y-17804]|uniref:uncharacterized protein n=1 Tax=Saitoella complicata (strain BCRC 22490 / CBS 7301 / JCM 7358 / NBRC 10748 / NRRL Y-17804) TaxID=698492 RepID=UPI0008675E87